MIAKFLICIVVLHLVASCARHSDEVLTASQVSRLSEDDIRTFIELAAAGKQYVIRHNGLLPIDPYQMLILDGQQYAVGRVLIYGGHTVSFSRILPTKLNPDVTKNPSYLPLFFFRRSSGEYLVCAWDFSVHRVTGFSDKEREIEQLLRTCKQPIWEEERSAFLHTGHVESLVWNEIRQCYTLPMTESAAY